MAWHGSHIFRPKVFELLCWIALRRRIGHACYDETALHATLSMEVKITFKDAVMSSDMREHCILDVTEYKSIHGFLWLIRRDGGQSLTLVLKCIKWFLSASLLPKFPPTGQFSSFARVQAAVPIAADVQIIVLIVVAYFQRFNQDYDDTGGGTVV